MQFTDTASVAGMRLTNDGYLVAEVRCARTGCQTYLGAELGLNDKETVTVFRPEAAVFDKASLATFAGKPVTLGHPAQPVTAENWKDHAIGSIGEEIARDGEFVRVPMTLMDAAAIRAVQDGTREISMGYTTGISIEDGVAPDGTPYQAVQTGPIRINHLAIVPKARGGAELRVGDGADTWGVSPVPTAAKDSSAMTDKALRTVVVGDEAVETTDAGARAIEKLKAQIVAKDAEIRDKDKDHADAIAAKDEEIGTLKADVKTAQDAAKVDIDKLVADRAALVEQVKAVDAKIDPKGKTDAELRKAAVAARLGDEMVKDASDAEVLGMFKAIAKDAGSGDAVRAALKDAPAPVGTAAAQDHAFQASVADLNAWRTAGNQEA
ncbi:DUF2213 domain-containing protein [Paracoccus sp. DMF]|uniref:DUF2213 domain-containing protein n=1 Tax=Paracoccus sp. DMF TaxID=400837 RepID=UPI0011002911|nr:DUF2213 domain-containing protein [Paracoccus sp. DMF]MCV2448468.1 DUF2213 domain-containing protein [Paracoccus sp. DMF]